MCWKLIYYVFSRIKHNFDHKHSRVLILFSDSIMTSNHLPHFESNIYHAAHVMSRHNSTKTISFILFDGKDNKKKSPASFVDRTWLRSTLFYCWFQRNLRLLLSTLNLCYSQVKNDSCGTSKQSCPTQPSFERESNLLKGLPVFFFSFCKKTFLAKYRQNGANQSEKQMNFSHIHTSSLLYTLSIRRIVPFRASLWANFGHWKGTWGFSLGRVENIRWCDGFRYTEFHLNYLCLWEKPLPECHVRAHNFSSERLSVLKNWSHGRPTSSILLPPKKESRPRRLREDSRKHIPDIGSHQSSSTRVGSNRYR